MMPWSERTIKYLTQDELKQFFDVIEDKRDKSIFALIYHYGLRVSEATLIKLSDVDFQRNRIYIYRKKGSISGEWILRADDRKLLREYLGVRKDNGEALFTGREGNLSAIRIAQLFKQYVKEARLDRSYSVHCLKHSLATHMLDNGEDIITVADHLGHRNIQNTTVYAKTRNLRRDEAVRRLERSREIVQVR